MAIPKEDGKKKSKRHTKHVDDFLREAKKSESVVIIRPHQFLKSGGAGTYCKLCPEFVEVASLMAEAGCSDKDIRDKLGLTQTIYFQYMNQGRVIEEYLKGMGIEPSIYHGWKDDLPSVVDLEDESGNRARIYQTHIKYEFYRAVVDARIKGNIEDLETIRKAGKKDWKAAAYVLENRSKEYKKDYKEDDNSPRIQVQNNTLIQNIMTTAKQLEQQDVAQRLLSENGGAENDDEIINAEYEKYVKEQLERSDDEA